MQRGDFQSCWYIHIGLNQCWSSSLSTQLHRDCPKHPDRKSQRNSSCVDRHNTCPSEQLNKVTPPQYCMPINVNQMKNVIPLGNVSKVLADKRLDSAGVPWKCVQGGCEWFGLICLTSTLLHNPSNDFDFYSLAREGQGFISVALIHWRLKT
jgi:hypothetical protein